MKNFGYVLATKMLVDNKRKVRFMYREEAKGADSGWRFFCGDEDQAYIDNSDNVGMYNIETILNIDKDISPYLSALKGTVLEREDANSVFRQLAQYPFSGSKDILTNKPYINANKCTEIISFDMKAAMSYYFDKLNTYYMEKRGTRPAVPYRKNLDTRLLLSEPSKSGYVEWQALLQAYDIDFNAIEQQLGFELQNEFREFYKSYLFLRMSGRIGKAELFFDPIVNECLVAELVLRQYRDAQHLFPNTQIFLIGTAIVDDDDRYSLYYDNADGETFCYEPEDRIRLSLCTTLSRIIGTMEVFVG